MDRKLRRTLVALRTCRLILEHSDHTARCTEGNCPAVTTSRISWSFRCQRSLFQPKPEPLPDINERFAESFD
jgi:hypothetical protein